MYTGTATIDGVPAEPITGTLEECIRWADQLFNENREKVSIQISSAEEKE